MPAQVQVVPHSITRDRVSPEVRKMEKTTRICLRCDRKFKSYGPGNRLCPLCGGTVPPEMRRARGSKRIYSGADVESD